jgi:general secretion pathway protein A
MQNNNFLNFFGLRETPFNVNLDPRFLFVTQPLEKAFSELMDAMHNGNCFALITGDVGTGKTTLMHRLRRELMHEGTPTAFLFYTHLNRTHLLDFILTNFGIPYNSGETIDNWKHLENWLVEHDRGGQTPVLLVDEAQGLPLSAFEEIRMLLNLETPRKKLLQIVLAGGLELEEKLKRVQMRELQQRITVRCKTATLNRDETFDYVRNRLQVGGAGNQPPFQPDAMDAIYSCSHGIPRVINVLCEQALINACANQVHVVPPYLIQDVARTFQWEHARHLPVTESPSSLRNADSASVPRIAAPEQPLMALMADCAILDEQPAVLPIVASTEPLEMSSEALPKDRNRTPIPDPPAAPVQQRPENIALGPLGERLIAFRARGEEKVQSAELSNSPARNLLAEFIQELENQKKFSNSAVRADIRGREARQSAPRPVAVKINDRRARPLRRAASPFWTWWFYGPRSGWWRKIGTVVNLPRWRQRCDSLQRWLKEPIRLF